MFAERARENLEELVIYLEDADRGFAVVEVNQYDKQQEILKEIEAAVPGKKKIFVDLKQEMREGDLTHIDVVRKAVRENEDAEIVVVLNFHLLAEGDSERERELIRDLNFSRDIYANLRKLLVFFFPSYFVDLLIGRAVDFWGFVSVRFEFLEGVYDGGQFPMDDGGIRDEKYLKNRRAFLEGLLENSKMSQEEYLKIVIELADTLQVLYAFDEAERHYHIGLGIAQSINNKEMEAYILINIGLICKIRGDYEHALSYLREGNSISEAEEYKNLIVLAKFNIGETYQCIGDIDKALDYFNYCSGISLKENDKIFQSIILFNLGKCYEIKEDYEKALHYYEGSYNISSEIPSKEGEMSALNGMGTTHMALKNFRQAIDYFEESIEIAIEIKDKKAIAGYLYNTAGAYLFTGDAFKALDYIKRSLQIQEELGWLERQEITLKTLGKIYGTLGDKQQAAKYLKQSESINEKLKSMNTNHTQ